MGLTKIREGIARNLETIPDLSESAYLKSNPTLPAAEVQPGEVEYDIAFHRGADTYRLIVRVMVGVTTDKGAQQRLDRMLEPSGRWSVKAAVEQDLTLGGACDDLRVTRCTGYRIYSREGAPPALGAEWEVEVTASGQ